MLAPLVGHALQAREQAVNIINRTNVCVKYLTEFSELNLTITNDFYFISFSFGEKRAKNKV